MKRTRRQHGVFAAADDGSPDGGGGAAVVDSGAAAVVVADTPEAKAAAAAAAKPATSLLDQAAPPSNDWLPEKYRVTKEDGSLDEAASARKLAEGHKALEIRLGTSELPPKTPEEYVPAVTVEGVNMDELKADPLYQGFLKGAHAKGLTNDQVSYVLNEYLTRAPELAGNVQELNAEEARAELGKFWGSEEAVGTNLRKGYGALKAYAQAGDEANPNPPGSFERLKTKYANDPDFWAFAARVGKDLGEDTGPNNPGGMTPMDVDALMKSKAYWDPTKPDHEKIKAQVKAHFAAQYPQKN